jgi:hypothetical protein
MRYPLRLILPALIILSFTAQAQSPESSGSELALYMVDEVLSTSCLTTTERTLVEREQAVLAARLEALKGWTRRAFQEYDDANRSYADDQVLARAAAGREAAICAYERAFGEALTNIEDILGESHRCFKGSRDAWRYDCEESRVPTNENSREMPELLH